MGSACCVSDRKVHKDEEEGSDSVVNEKSQKKLLFNNEDDPENVTDIYINNKDTFEKDPTAELKIAITKAKANSSDKSVPFLVTDMDYAGTKIGILSRNYDWIKQYISYKTTDQSNIEGFVIKEFKPSSKEKSIFLKELADFIMYIRFS